MRAPNTLKSRRQALRFQGSLAPWQTDPLAPDVRAVAADRLLEDVEPLD
jgi:hypothetical protein